MHIGWGRFRSALAPIAVVGVFGTFLTAIGGAVLLHAAFGFDWYIALLLATALAPTDPTVVFSVLGRRQVAGRAGIILEGESGANDPVGIAVMASLIAAGGLHPGQVVHAPGDFAVQMAVGAGVGLVGGRALLWFVRRVPLPSEGLYPLRTLAAALALFGAATVPHGSGFLAVFVAGITLGDQRAPYKHEIERFHGALASLGEIVAFAVLGLTVDLAVLARADVWVPGLLYGIDGHSQGHGGLMVTIGERCQRTGHESPMIGDPGVAVSHGRTPPAAYSNGTCYKRSHQFAFGSPSVSKTALGTSPSYWRKPWIAQLSLTDLGAILPVSKAPPSLVAMTPDSRTTTIRSRCVAMHTWPRLTI
jgi:hypothetical protein